MLGMCDLCHAIKNEPSRLIYQDDHVVVVLNFEPIKHGHVLIMPIRHAENLSDLTSAESSAFLKALDRCMKAVTKYSEEPPISLIHGWKHRSQPHLHAHVLPSQHPIRGLFSVAEGTPRRLRLTDEVLKEMADQIRPHHEE
ncbi:MAG: HIT family protein [Patescibacteria group bacterium]